VGAGLAAGGVGRGVADLGASGADAGASSGGGSWAIARPAQQRTSAKEPTSFGRDIDQLSHLGRGQHAIVKTHQYVTSVAMPPGILFISEHRSRRFLRAVSSSSPGSNALR
jgi:hypothetical protein